MKAERILSLKRQEQNLRTLLVGRYLKQWHSELRTYVCEEHPHWKVRRECRCCLYERLSNSAPSPQGDHHVDGVTNRDGESKHC